MRQPSIRPIPRASNRLLPLAADHFPAFELGERPTLLDPHDVADMVLVGLVMGVVFLGTANGLLHDRMGEPPFDAHDHGFVLLVANDYALQHALRHLSPTPAWLWRRRVAALRHASGRQWS